MPPAKKKTANVKDDPTTPAKEPATDPRDAEIAELKARLAGTELALDRAQQATAAASTPANPTPFHFHPETNPNPDAPPRPVGAPDYGDKDPAVMEWLEKYYPKEFQRRFEGRNTKVKGYKFQPKELNYDDPAHVDPGPPTTYVDGAGPAQ
jgi:hypothetical protein